MEEKITPCISTPLPESSKEELSFQDQTFYYFKIKAKLFKKNIFIRALMFFD